MKCCSEVLQKCCSRTPTTSSFDQWHHLQITGQSQNSFQQRTIGAVQIRRQKTGWGHIDPMAGWKVPDLGPTSPDTQAASHINGTSQKAGGAAEQAAIQKADKYRELPAKYFFIPVAVETHGPINVDGANFLSESGRRIFFFFFRMLAQSYTPNIYTPTPIPLLCNPFTIVLHKRRRIELSSCEKLDCAYFRKNFNRNPAWKCGFVCGVLRRTGTAQTIIRSKNKLTI